MENLSLTYTNPGERDDGGRLLPDVRERVMGEIENYIRKSGYINYSFLSEKLGLSKLTIRGIIAEMVEEWKKYNSYDVYFEIQWLRNLIREIEQKPETFTPQRTALINFKIGIYDKIHGLNRLMASDNSISFVKEEVNYNVFGELKPKTMEALRKMKELQNQQEVQGNSENM